MDPSTDELLAMGDVGDAQAWIGMSDALLAGVREVIGNFQLFREVALIPDVVWDVAGVAAVARVDRPPMPLEVGQVGSLRRVSRMRIGEPATAAAQVPQAHAFPPGPPLAGGAPMVGGPRTLKMKRLVDQVDDTEILAWSSARHALCMKVYKVANGGVEAPKDDAPTADMLAALDWRLTVAQSPWVDFALWRPHGMRMQRAWKLMAQFVNTLGDHVPYEVAGPPDYATWLVAWRIFSVSMVALGAATGAKLAVYARCICKFSGMYKDSLWWLLALSEDRMRLEEMPLIWARGEEEAALAKAEGKPHAFNALPWDWCFLEAADNSKDDWEDELHRKATHHVIGLTKKAEIEDGGFGGLERPTTSGAPPPSARPRP